MRARRVRTYAVQIFGLARVVIRATAPYVVVAATFWSPQPESSFATALPDHLQVLWLISCHGARARRWCMQFFRGPTQVACGIK